MLFLSSYQAALFKQNEFDKLYLGLTMYGMQLYKKNFTTIEEVKFFVGVDGFEPPTLCL